MLGLGLEPEEIALRAGGELQHKDPTVRGLFSVRLIRCEAPIGWDHDQVQRGLGVRSSPRTPAEVDEIIFRIEVDVPGSGLRFDHGVGSGKLWKIEMFSTQFRNMPTRPLDQRKAQVDVHPGHRYPL